MPETVEQIDAYVICASRIRNNAYPTPIRVMWDKQAALDEMSRLAVEHHDDGYRFGMTETKADAHASLPDRKGLEDSIEYVGISGQVARFRNPRTGKGFEVAIPIANDKERSRLRANAIAKDCRLFVQAQEEIVICNAGPDITDGGVKIMSDLIYKALTEPDMYPAPGNIELERETKSK